MTSNKAIIRSVYDAFAAGDVPTALGVMDDKVEWTEAEGWPLFAGTLVGPDAVVDGVLRRLGEIGDEFAVHATKLVAEDDTVVALGHYTWKQRSTGDPVRVQMVHVWTLDDGKVTSFQQHVDTLKTSQGMG